LGDASQAGLSTPEQRLARLAVGVNPYVTGTSLPGDSPVFFGREQALGEILDTLRRPERPGCVSMLGERRIGKSSLLNQIYQALSANPGLVSVHATAQNWNHDSQQHFYANLHACLAHALGLKGEKPVEDYPGLRDFLLAQARLGRRFVLMIDEFEIMAGNPAFDAYFFSNLRALADRPEYRLGFLISSRRPLKDLCNAHRIEASSFWNIFGSTIVLGLLAEEEARGLVVEVFGRCLANRHTGRERRYPDCMDASKPDYPWSLDSGDPCRNDGDSVGRQPLAANGSACKSRHGDADLPLLRLWEQEIRPLTGCHPALIQIAADTHWNAIAGAYKVDELAVTMRVREYLEYFWNKCSEDKAAKAILLKSAKGQTHELKVDELSRHTGMDCRYPEHRDVTVGTGSEPAPTCHPSVAPPAIPDRGRLCRNDGEIFNPTASPPQLDYRTAKLVQRGLLTADLQPFSTLFIQVILESCVEDTGGSPFKPNQIPTTNQSFDVFLSHNSQDKPIVRELALALKSRNLKVWLDEEQLIPGRPWQEALETIIQTTLTAVVLIGKSGLGPWETPEMRACLNEFVERKLPVIPVLLPDAATIPELPLFLKSFTWVDLRGGLTVQALDRLEWGITGIKPKSSHNVEGHCH